MRYKNNIGPQARRRRYALGWSQSILAAKLQIAGFDISRSGVSKIEACRKRRQDGKTCKTLTYIIGMDLNQAEDSSPPFVLRPFRTCNRINLSGARKGKR